MTASLLPRQKLPVEIAGGIEEKHAWKMAAPLSRSMAMLDGLISGCARMCSSAYVCTRARSRMRVTASLQVCVRCVCACKGVLFLVLGA